MKKEEFITYRHYYNFYTSQPYFIWHKLDSNTLEIQEYDEESEENEKGIWNFSSLEDLDDPELEKLDFFKININVFSQYPWFFQQYIEKEYKDKKIYTIKSKSTIDKIQETQRILQSDEYDIILFPVFEYRNCIARPDILFIKEKKISSLKLSTSTKRVDLLKAHWQFWIVKSALYDVFKLEDISIFLLDINQKMKKNEVLFKEVVNINVNKSAKTTTNKEDFEAKKISKQQGMSTEEFEQNPTWLKLSNFVKDNMIPTIKGKKQKTIVSAGYFLEINDAIDEIIKAKQVISIKPVSELDDGLFQKSPFFVDIVKELNSDLSGFSGLFLSAKKIIKCIENEEFLHEIKQSDDYKFFNEKNKIEINTEKQEALHSYIQKFLQKDARIIWFDFESISLPFPSIDYTLPYQQIVFQVSIISTINEEKIQQSFDEVNLVYDPLTYHWTNFVDIIKRIYSDKADYYVVFNKAYEITRLNEMLVILKKYHDLGDARANYYQCKEFVKHITDNIIDLQDPFRFKWIKVSDLKGYYSIKKIEKFITQYDYKTKERIIPYKELEVQNGMQAMNQGTFRYLKKIGDVAWKEVKHNLQKYCQNDVLAMLMVWHFIKLVLKIN
ncbi:DUF2779 domain-containing protein [Mesomycoplasma hyorhinis]|uniref:DUF2779 domain-containing protein n=1 Tax=Mesomycoplasma hyorhinis TaxID=2100 RepID=UPI003DA497C8